MSDTVPGGELTREQAETLQKVNDNSLTPRESL